ncbi:hypothetical protein XH98_00190 [Bradyrhizobium sp. CCBAU 51745]|uniref:outer membrane protein n=1 Tax=Bradyrhizobium sp. CCBAU 51745 TaxID=1325099 RepID=UPI002304FB1C|nr:outer membrane protein [Bradyrhizobium sp. CCBAU 51745]MDA9437555.1 hypothetical protein [Bradyrhizobium sp. CCBAU 51745]
MKRIVMGLAAASLLTTHAMAADLAAKPYVKAPPIVDPGYNWTGFYAGLNGGYSWGRSNATADIGGFFPAGSIATVKHNVDGGLGGGQVGYNWQVDRKWVVGVEADIQGTGERGRSNDTFGTIRIGSFGITQSSATSTDFPWFATFRGRGGFLVDPSLLLYATGGLAVGEVKFASTPTVTIQRFDGNSNTPIGGPISATGATVSESQTRVGWTLGAGLEKKFAPNWSAKLEYLYVDLGTKTYFSGTGNDIDVRFRDHILRAGFNYQFTAGPVVAKY